MILAAQVMYSVALGNVLHSSKPQFPDLRNGPGVHGNGAFNGSMYVRVLCE